MRRWFGSASSPTSAEGLDRSGKRTDQTFDLVMVGLFVLALVIRLALYFPVAAFPGDADSVFSGLCAFHILDGYLPVFTPIQDARHGAVACYITAAYVALVGPNRVSLALSALTSEAVYLFCMALFLREVLPRAQAWLAFLFVAIPPARVLAVTYQPYSYTATMAACAATLFFAARWRRKADVCDVVMFGLVAGFNFWIGAISLMVTGPAVLWIAWRRGFRLIHEGWPALIGGLIGASPWIAYNLTHGFVSLHSRFVQPVSTLAQVGDNLSNFFSKSVSTLLLSQPVENWGVLSLVLLAAYCVIAVGLVADLAKDSRPSQDAGGESVRSLVGLGLLVFMFVLVMNIFSQSGSAGLSTVRYVLPLYIIVPPLMAMGLMELGTISRLLAALAAVAIVSLNLSLYRLPGTAARAALTAELEQHERLQEILASAHVKALFGDYWLVYHLNFDSQRHILGIPIPGPDYLGYRGTLPAQGLRWAYIAGDAATLQARARKVNAIGKIVELDGVKLFLPDQPSEMGTKELIRVLSQP